MFLLATPFWPYDEVPWGLTELPPYKTQATFFLTLSSFLLQDPRLNLFQLLATGAIY